jgi:hypothetical protein
MLNLVVRKVTARLQKVKCLKLSGYILYPCTIVLENGVSMRYISHVYLDFFRCHSLHKHDVSKTDSSPEDEKSLLSKRRVCLM